MTQPAATQQKNLTWPDLGIAPGVVLRVFGMRRAGNHAVINWLLRNAPSKNSLFLNNCAVGRSPFKTFKTLELNGQRRVPKADQQALPDFATEAGNGATLLISYEDQMPLPQDGARPISSDLNTADITHDIIIYRSFLNWSASLLRKLSNNPAYTQANRTIIMLRAIEMYSRALELIAAPDQLGLIAICYDDWQALAPYRNSVLDRLGFPQRDDSLGEVQVYGGGSSFQPETDVAAELGTNCRWSQMAQDPGFLVVLWLAAQDQVLLERLDAVFPQDASRLRQLTETIDFSASLEIGGVL